VRVSSSVTTLEFPSSGITTRSISPAATESISSASLAASGLPAVPQQRSNSLRPTSPAPITLLQEQAKAQQNQSSQGHQQGQPALGGSQPPPNDESGVDLAPQNEEEERRKRLQLYVFILRCVAYPFSAKQPNDMSRRQMKVTKEQLDTLQKRFQAFLKGETTIAADEAFQNAVQSYTEVFLKSDRVAMMVVSGACSQHDFREVFRNNIEKRVRSLPEIDGLSKETSLRLKKSTGRRHQQQPTLASSWA
ncbi:calcium-dependent secretion activator 1-like, partial [Tropilaelaps mercedesae]